MTQKYLVSAELVVTGGHDVDEDESDAHAGVGLELSQTFEDVPNDRGGGGASFCRS